MPAPSLRKSPAAWAAVLVATLGLSACSPAEDAADPTAPVATAPAEVAADPAAAATATENTANALAALSVDELRDSGIAALRDQRLYSPAGENAMEYYLALRQKSAAADVDAESALIDLMPYALIAAEQAINEDDFVEAERLLALMARTDPEAPSLSRIRDAIASRRTAAAERERNASEREARAVAAAAAARAEAATAAIAPALAAPAEPPPPSPTPAPVAIPIEVAPTPAPVTAPVATAPAIAAPTPQRSGPPRAISTPQPPYPREAARSRTPGSVTVQFVVGADGRVTDVQVLRARPRGLFEESVRETVSTWRFEPPGESVTLTRTFDFRM